MSEIFTYCNNPNCEKTHCARHYTRIKDGKFVYDYFNAENKFKCPFYYPNFRVRHQK